MNIKDRIKKIKFIRNLGKYFNIRKEYNNDAKDFYKNYMYSSENEPQLQYKILYLVHSLEKGLSNEELRPFGKTKCMELMTILVKYKRNIFEDNIIYNMGMSILCKWKETYDYHNWAKDDIYNEVNSFLKQANYKIVPVGIQEVNKYEFERYKDFDYFNAIKSRHSVRKFSNISLKSDDIEYCVKSAILSPSACNRQMIKIYQVSNYNMKRILENKIIGISGFDKTNINYFIITFDISAFSFYGERNQGYLNAGFFAMNFVNSLHFKGIGSCFLQWSNNRKDDEEVRKKLNIPKTERIAVIIAAGYYIDKYIVPKSYRKTTKDVFKNIV